MKAVVIQEAGKASVTDIKEQSMRSDYIKVKTAAVAVNPTDFHHTAGVGRIGGILGCDVAGTVVDVGQDCTSDVKPGDIVYGVCHCANNDNAEDGAFAEYAMVKDGHIAKVPDNLTLEECASLGTGLTTVGQALYMTLKFPLPPNKTSDSFPIFISGGSSATGTLAIQYAKHSGLEVITTASPQNFDLVKSRGADVVFDYNDPECGQKIREYTKNSLCYVFDCVSTAASYKLVAQAFPTKSAETLHLVTLLPPDGWTRIDVQTHTLLAYTTFGEAFSKFGMNFPPLEEHFKFGKIFWKLTAQLVAEGQIKPHPVTIRKGGFHGVVSGISDMSLGIVRGTKLVYRVDDEAAGNEGASQQPVMAPSLTNWQIEK
ncbi:hypothetical protein GJ744_009290 [Endocarpon pusillum]|uniref:Enoyl reductase (ER) domain-containing protein n=1 Tax=Endocarpon pusillum TaxID=364733 RepID=A0A8H7E3W8_9EURO|nr:hypothetical protein GJ744_009290 [Endocarpon pusillum]